MDEGLYRLALGVFALGYGVNHFLGHRVLAVITAISAIILGVLVLLGF